MLVTRLEKIMMWMDLLSSSIFFGTTRGVKRGLARSFVKCVVFALLVQPIASVAERDHDLAPPLMIHQANARRAVSSRLDSSGKKNGAKKRDKMSESNIRHLVESGTRQNTIFKEHKDKHE